MNIHEITLAIPTATRNVVAGSAGKQSKYWRRMKPRKFPKFSAVAIRWLDATSRSAGWTMPAEKYELGRAYTVGIVIAQDDKSITLAQSLITIDGQLQQVSEPLSLPWGMIEIIEEVNMATKKTKKVAKKTTKKGN